MERCARSRKCYIRWTLPVSLKIAMQNTRLWLTWHLIHTNQRWFFTYNFLSEKIPKQDTQLGELGRRAILGFCSSAVSDTCSNSIRVVKVYKQSHPDQLSYIQVVRQVLKESGISGLMFRGLETKILANGLQGILFSILWKQFEEVLFPKK